VAGPYRDEKMRKNLSITFFYYLCCGGLATVLDWSTFYIAKYILKFGYIIAVGISFSLGTSANYTTNKLITFRNKFKNVPLQFAVFLLGAGSALILTFIQMVIFVEYLNFNPMISRISITGIMLFYNFAFHNFYTFGRLR
jgi:putative flippase GtrA